MARYVIKEVGLYYVERIHEIRCKDEFECVDCLNRGMTKVLSERIGEPARISDYDSTFTQILPEVHIANV